LVHRFGAYPQQPDDLRGIHVLREQLRMDLQETPITQVRRT
jgi:hypothetical protein